MANKFQKTIIFSVTLLTLSFFIPTPFVLAIDYPTRPISLIIQFTPGTTTDIIARKLGDVVSKELRQPLVPINKTGGGGTIGVAEIIRSKPDGYTIGCINMPTLAIIPHMQTLPYDPLRDISHICVISPYEYGLYVKGDAPWNSLEEFIDYARKNPGKVTHGSPGPGTTNHLIMVRIGKDLNLDWRHVPYKGDGELIPAVLGGSVLSGVGSPAALMPHIKAGKLKLLVVTSKDRWSYFPEVPTLLEKGYTYFQASYLSLGAPAGTPEPIRQKLEDVIKKAIQDPALKKEFEEKIYAKLEYISGEEFKKFIGEQFLFYKDFLKTIGMTK